MQDMIGRMLNWRREGAIAYWIQIAELESLWLQQPSSLKALRELATPRNLVAAIILFPAVLITICRFLFGMFESKDGFRGQIGSSVEESNVGMGIKVQYVGGNDPGPVLSGTVESVIAPTSIKVKYADGYVETVDTTKHKILLTMPEPEVPEDAPETTEPAPTEPAEPIAQ